MNQHNGFGDNDIQIVEVMGEGAAEVNEEADRRAEREELERVRAENAVLGANIEILNRAARTLHEEIDEAFRTARNVTDEMMNRAREANAELEAERDRNREMAARNQEMERTVDDLRQRYDERETVIEEFITDARRIMGEMEEARRIERADVRIEMDKLKRKNEEAKTRGDIWKQKYKKMKLKYSRKSVKYQNLKRQFKNMERAQLGGMEENNA